MQLEAFEGNRAETATMLPTIERFMKAPSLKTSSWSLMPGWCPRLTDGRSRRPGCPSSFVAKTPDIPYVIAEWRRKHPGADIPDGHVFTQRWPASASDQRRDQVIY